MPLAYGEDEIKERFKAFGEVTKVGVSKKSKKGKGQGFCIVTFAEHESAKSALLNLNDRLLEGADGKFLSIDFKQSKVALENLYKTNPDFQDLMKTR